MAQRGVETLGGRRIGGHAGPHQNPARAAHEARDLRAEEPADGEHLDGEQPEHRAQHRAAHVEGRPREHDADEQEDRLRDHDRGLGDDDRGHALGVRDVTPHEPGLHRLAADRAAGGDEIERFTRQTRAIEPPERRAIAREREAPAERVDGEDHAVGQADENELPPGERAQRRQDGLGSDAVDEHGEQDGPGHEEERFEESHGTYRA